MAEKMNLKSEDVYDITVIGAGWSGLAAAKTFLQVRPDSRLLIIDGNATIGGTWSQERLYDHLRAEAGHGFFHFPDLPMDRKHITPEGWIEGPAVHRYLCQYAEKFGLDKCIWLNTIVDKAEQRKTSGMWRLETSSTISGNRTLYTSKLIVASGLTSEPNIPIVPRDNFHGQILHSKELGLSEVSDKLTAADVERVTVYGGSKSAFDAVYFLLKAGKQVDWIIRPEGGGPSLMTPRKMLGVISSFELNNTRFFGVFSPNVFDKSSGWYRLFHGPNRLPGADTIVMTFWRVTTWMLKFSANYQSSPNGTMLEPSMGLESSFWSPATLGVMTHDELWKWIHEGKNIAIHRKSVASLAGNHVLLDDGTRLRSDAMVFATGWKASHSMFADDEVRELGLPASTKALMEGRWRRQHLRLRMDAEVIQDLPLLARSPDGNSSESEDDYHLYRAIVPAGAKYADRSLAFIGFLRNTGLPIVLQAQALWATAYLLGDLPLPSESDREVEAAGISAWTRRRYVCGRKVPFALVDWFPYIDLLYRDLHINSRRKSNWFSETFGLYLPEDFAGVTSEWMARRAQPVKSETREKIHVPSSAVWTVVVLLVVIVYFV